VSDHELGRCCDWSRGRRLLEIERELLHDADDPLLIEDGEAWAARRPRHVLLRQALSAYASPEGMTRDSDDAVVVAGPTAHGATPVRLPSGREHEEEDIRRDAARRKPLHLYGCPFVLEARPRHPRLPYLDLASTCAELASISPASPRRTAASTSCTMCCVRRASCRRRRPTAPPRTSRRASDPRSRVTSSVRLPASRRISPDLSGSPPGSCCATSRSR
jgi:hypothetical protein